MGSCCWLAVLIAHGRALCMLIRRIWSSGRRAFDLHSPWAVQAFKRVRVTALQTFVLRPGHVMSIVHSRLLQDFTFRAFVHSIRQSVHSEPFTLCSSFRFVATSFLSYEASHAPSSKMDTDTIVQLVFGLVATLLALIAIFVARRGRAGTLLSIGSS